MNKLPDLICTMSQIEIHVQMENGGEPRTIKIAADATIKELLKQVGGDAPLEVDEEILLLVEKVERTAKPGERLSDFGIKHGHHVQLRKPHREVVIIVNAREKKWDKKEISYEEVVVLAFGSLSTDPNVVYTVTYSKGPNDKREGSLVRGQSVKVKNGMIFNVSQTNKS